MAHRVAPRSYVKPAEANPEPEAQRDQDAGWDFGQGEEIVPGRVALRHLGTGRRSEGYLCWDRRLGALVAVKVLRPGATEQTKALTRELEVLGSLEHPSVPLCFDACTEGPRPHLVLEYAPGPSLRDALDDAPLEPADVLPWALAVAGALHHLASRSIVHWDVKPENIVLSSPAKLIDFGTARERHESKHYDATRPPRTSHYKAPEQCEAVGSAGRGAPADVWGLGMCIYEALAARSPFPKRVQGERAPQLVHQPAPLPRELPAKLTETVLECLRREPGERPSAAEVAARLEPLANEPRAESRARVYLRRAAQRVPVLRDRLG